MSFMDDVWAGAEQEALKGLFNLQLWINTIAPVGSKLQNDLNNFVADLAYELRYETELDEHIGVNFIKLENVDASKTNE